MTTSDKVTESNSALISPEVTVAKDVGTEQNSTSEENTVIVKLPMDSAHHSGNANENEGTLIPSAVIGAILEILLNR